MTDHSALEQTLVSTLGLDRPPVAVAFLDAPPAGVEKFAGVEPSGCSFWRLAAAGRAFYTVPADHSRLRDRQPHPQHAAAAGARARSCRTRSGS